MFEFPWTRRRRLEIEAQEHEKYLAQQKAREAWSERQRRSPQERGLEALYEQQQTVHGAIKDLESQLSQQRVLLAWLESELAGQRTVEAALDTAVAELEGSVAALGEEQVTSSLAQLKIEIEAAAEEELKRKAAVPVLTPFDATPAVATRENGDGARAG